MSCKIFISHSSFDSIYAEMLIGFLKHGIGLDRDDIFCSSDPETGIPLGVDFNDFIIGKLKESSDFYTIAIISNAYYNSRYCIYELGALWGLSKTNNIIPFLIEDMDRGSPKDFIRYAQSIKGSEENDINKLATQLKADDSILKKPISTENFEKEKKKLIDQVIGENAKRNSNNSKAQQSENRRQRIKLVAFDFDGTILQGINYTHSWISIWNSLNLPKKKREELLKKHMEDPKDYNFQRWCSECVDLFKEQNFKRENIVDIIKAGGLKLATNFAEVVTILKALGIKIIIISGGIDTFIEETINENLREFIDKIFINEFIYDNEGFLQDVKAFQFTEADSVGKARVLENYCISNNIKLSEVAYVGDRVNDIEALHIAGVPIVYPADKSHAALRERQFKFNMVHEDSMVHILPYILD